MGAPEEKLKFRWDVIFRRHLKFKVGAGQFLNINFPSNDVFFIYEKYAFLSISKVLCSTFSSAMVKDLMPILVYPDIKTC